MEIYYEETFKQDFWESSYWGFSGRQKMCLRIKMNATAIGG